MFTDTHQLIRIRIRDLPDTTFNNLLDILDRTQGPFLRKSSEAAMHLIGPLISGTPRLPGRFRIEMYAPDDIIRYPKGSEELLTVLSEVYAAIFPGAERLIPDFFLVLLSLLSIFSGSSEYDADALECCTKGWTFSSGALRKWIPFCCSFLDTMSRFARRGFIFLGLEAFVPSCMYIKSRTLFPDTSRSSMYFAMKRSLISQRRGISLDHLPLCHAS